MQKNIGKVNAAFPTPIVVVGAMVGDKPNWFEVAWVGIAENDMITLSVTPSHETCKGINATGVLSVSPIDAPLIPRADYVGIVSGHKVDKSQVFAWHKGEAGAPILDESPVSMECRLVDTYAAHGCHLLICQVVNTYADESILDAKGKIDYQKFKPVLFEPGFKYLATGDVIGSCIAPGKEYAKEL